MAGPDPRGPGVAATSASTTASAVAPAQGGQNREREEDPDRDAERDRDHDHDIGFAIPARDAIWIADQLRSTGRVDRAYLGVRLESADVAPGPAADGARLSEVLADTPASGAGLRAGDRIVALDSHPIRSPSNLTDRLDRIRARTEVTLGVMRPRGGGREGADGNQDRDRVDIRLQTASRPDPSLAEAIPAPAPTPTPDIGSGPAQQLGASDIRGEPLAPSRTIVRAASGMAPGATAPADSPAAIPATPLRAVIAKTSSSAGAGSPDAAAPVPLRPATVATATSSPVKDPAPAQRPLPLETRATPPRPADLEPISPRAVIDRLERLERRLERLERRESQPAIPAGGAGARD